MKPSYFQFFFLVLLCSQNSFSQDKKVPLHESDFDIAVVGGVGRTLQPPGSFSFVGSIQPVYRVSSRFGIGIDGRYSAGLRMTSALAVLKYYFEDENSGFSASLGAGYALITGQNAPAAQLNFAYDYPFALFDSVTYTWVIQAGLFSTVSSSSLSDANASTGVRAWF